MLTERTWGIASVISRSPPSRTSRTTMFGEEGAVTAVPAAARATLFRKSLSLKGLQDSQKEGILSRPEAAAQDRLSTGRARADSSSVVVANRAGGRAAAKRL